MTPARSTLFLIVGAGGNHGATGNYVARQLLARGLSVRAFVRQVDHRADQLKDLGAELAVGDLHDSAVRTSANGQPAMALYTGPRDGNRQLHWLHVLTAGAHGVSGVVAFQDIAAVRRFDLPAADERRTVVSD